MWLNVTPRGFTLQQPGGGEKTTKKIYLFKRIKTYTDGTNIKCRPNNSNIDFTLFLCEMANLITSHILDHLTCVSVCIFSITVPSWINTEREERDSCFLAKLLASKNWKQGKRPIQKCVTKHLTTDLGALLWEGKKNGFWTPMLPNVIMYIQQIPI